jgi:hypothetical protein
MYTPGATRTALPGIAVRASRAPPAGAKAGWLAQPANNTIPINIAMAGTSS